MTYTLGELQQKVQSQKDLIPSLYGEVDFSIVPERFTTDPKVLSYLKGPMAGRRTEALADQEAVERAKAFTMLGDTVADAYAALIPQYGFRKLIDMLTLACDKGLLSVEGAPVELINFIQSMERKPEWLDMDLVEKGARFARIQYSTLVPFATRGTFVATFINKYSGLPMALTGTLSDTSAMSRVNETATFFTTATLPGALERYGPGFKAAAMVRLMHSMVRFNLLKKTDEWNVETYGIPIPQVDQMPAGMLPAFLAAYKAEKQGRDYFTDREQAIVELYRYQSYLLGLPEDLLPATPKELMAVSLTYTATLRDGYDDKTNGELVRATMSSYRPKDKSLKSRVYNELERSFSLVFFLKVFAKAIDETLPEKMNLEPRVKDYINSAIVFLVVFPLIIFHLIAVRIPGISQIADKSLIRRLNKLLVDYGHAEFVTNVDNYSTNKKPVLIHE